VSIKDNCKGRSLKREVDLVTRSFKIAIAIIAFFDLKIKQFDIVNAFANAKRLVKSLLVAY
jgi:hypothetical protein